MTNPHERVPAMNAKRDALIHPAMWDQAQRLIAADSRAAWRKANTTKAGKRRKRHRPYSLPERTTDLVTALGKGNGEIVAGILLYQFQPWQTA